MANHPDLEEEQQFLDRAYEGLEAMRADATRMLESVLDLGRGGTFQSRTERDIVVRTSLARLDQLDIGDQALCFGRIDRVPDPGQSVGESFHIGRLGVSGEDHEPLVVDWRAPVAEPFYRATGLSPEGLARRRHLAVRGRQVVGLEDEVFADDAANPVSATAGDAAGDRLLDGDLSLGGPGALLAALGQVRTGRMGDIVATIQREQDEIIRSPLLGVLVVQGGPGTGKTAVALHRAAYLLYTHRFPLERQGVLVVGPNPLFLRYIEQVLPSLGETGVTLTTASGLVSDVRVRGADTARVARLKGDPRMVKVIARAVRTRERGLRDDVSVPFGSTRLTLRAERTEEIVVAARRRPGTHNARRRYVEQQVVRDLVGQFTGRREAATDLLGAEGAEDVAELGRRMRRVPEVVTALDRMWPRLGPQELLHDLFGAPALLRAAGRDVLSAEEALSLQRPRSASLEAVRWTEGDVALIDEARQLLGPRNARTPRRAERDRAARTDGSGPGGGSGPWSADGLFGSQAAGPTSLAVAADPDEIRSYGHIVVDEVQDLSPMQLRMLARRSISGSMTVVGDIAQATGPWAPRRWDDVTRHLAPSRPPHLVELTVSYRTPAEVVELAARVLAAAAPDIAPPTPVRASGFEPDIVRVRPDELLGEVAAIARREVAAVGRGRVAVLVPRGYMARVSQGLSARGLDPVDPRDPAGLGLAAPLVVLPADEANGLEFDSVIVVEPGLVAAEDLDGSEDGNAAARRGVTARGLRTLYVSLTRPTRRLNVVHAHELPVALAPGAPAFVG